MRPRDVAVAGDMMATDPTSGGPWRGTTVTGTLPITCSWPSPEGSRITRPMGPVTLTSGDARTTTLPSAKASAAASP